MWIINNIEDQIPLLVWQEISEPFFKIVDPVLANHPPYEAFFSPLTNPLANHQPISALFLSVFLSLFGRYGLNLFILFSSSLNLYLSTKFFKKYKFGIFFALIFAFSGYYWSHLGQHNVLLQIWVIPAFFIYQRKVEEDPGYKKSIKLGALLTIFTLISNYYGFILLLFLASAFVSVLLRKNFKLLRIYSLCVLASLSLTFLLLFPYVNANYIKHYSDDESHVVVKRSFEDFITFSSRPWYFVTPSMKNPVHGDLARILISIVESKNHFLTDDYFAIEHQGMFYGYLFLATVACVFVWILIKGNRTQRGYLVTRAIPITIILFLSLPPYFTISGLQIWTPGYLMYKFFPMFRVTSRVGILLLFLLVDLFAYMFNEYKTMKAISYNKSLVFIAFFTLVTLIETFVPFKLQKVLPPDVYVYLSTAEKEDARFVAYPYKETDDAFFWLPTHKKLLINPRGYETSSFSSEEFTNNLVSSNKDLSLQKVGADYLLVSKVTAPSNDIKFFNEYEEISIEKEFEEHILYKVN